MVHRNGEHDRCARLGPSREDGVPGGRQKHDGHDERNEPPAQAGSSLRSI